MNVGDLKNKVLGSLEPISKRYLHEVLASLVEIPTVSAWGGGDMTRGASLIASLFKELGFNVKVESEGGYPAVLAEIGEGSKSILIYNHYDVQPPDPLELWDSDPFKLRIEGGKVYGRGVADNKGNIAARLAALEALSPYVDDLDLKVKVIVEGEEEVGSPTLEKIVTRNIEWFKADGGIWETAYVRRDGKLSISLGFKGMIYVELTIREASRDVHSGYSPIIPNPAWRMAKMLTTLKDERGRVLVPQFYDDIDPEFLEMGEELLKLADNSDLEALKEELNLKSFIGDLKGYEALKALYLNPSINVSGLYSGYTGKGSKTIVPSEASTKLDIRLVPGQDPKKILEKLLEHLKAHGFKDVEVHVESMYKAGYTKPDASIVKASIEAAREAYNKEPQVIPMAAGSGPIYIFTDIAKTPMTGAGVGYYASKVHAPNENIRIEDFHKGVKHVTLTIINFVSTTITR